MSSEEIESSVKMIKILVSPTRRSIIKNIYRVPMTVSGLSRELNLNKSTVHKHLKILVENELVFRRENNNEFVYYELTENAKKIIEGKLEISISILMISLLVFIIGVFIISVYIERLLQPPAYWWNPTPDEKLLLIGVSLILSSIIMVIIYIYKIKKICK